MRHTLALLLALCALRAEFSPDHYRKLQAAAPEALVLVVESVDTRSGPSRDGITIDVTVAARVRQVTRSQAGLKPGDPVAIRYQVLLPLAPLPGPSQAPILGKAEVRPAFLKPADGKGFTLAAGGMSFERL